MRGVARQARHSGSIRQTTDRYLHDSTVAVERLSDPARAAYDDLLGDYRQQCLVTNSAVNIDHSDHMIARLCLLGDSFSARKLHEFSVSENSNETLSAPKA
jgi:ABC-type phosphonate transport system ATPase subunit